MARADRRAAPRGRLRAVCLATGLLVLAPPLPAGGPEGTPAGAADRLSGILEGTGTAFVLYDASRDRFFRFDEKRCRRRMSPFSTFKIPNTLIALETGAVKDAEAVVKWDPARHPRQESWPDSWARDQTLRTAFRNSVVWFYQDAALAVGPEAMSRYLERFHYGNRDLSGGQDRFWLGSSLEISAEEQVAFLRAFLGGRLGLKDRTTALAKEIFVLEREGASVLSAKTGGGFTAPGRALGWFVGYVERGDEVSVFALNTDGDSYAAIRDKRIDLAKRSLRALGVLPQAPPTERTVPAGAGRRRE